MKKVSVIIPVRDRKDYLELSLASYRNQTYPKNKFEIIIVNDGSNEDFLKDIEKTRWPFRLKVIHNPKPLGAGVARDLGVQAGKGDILLFTDSDMIVPPHFIYGHARHHHRKENLVVSSPYRYRIFTKLYPDDTRSSLFKKMLKHYPALEKKIPDDFKEQGRPVMLFKARHVESGKIRRIAGKINDSKKEKAYLKAYGPRLKGCSIPWMSFNSYSASMTRKTYRRVGGFYKDIRYRHTDRALGYRLYKKGYSFYADPDLIPIHQQHPAHKNMDNWIKDEYKNWLDKHPERPIYLFGVRLMESRIDKLFYSKLLSEINRIEKKDKKTAREIDRWIQAWVGWYLAQRKSNRLSHRHQKVGRRLKLLKSKMKRNPYTLRLFALLSKKL